MSDWDYEDDLASQEIVDEACGEIRKVNDLLNGIHRKMSESLHTEAWLTILSDLQVTKEITFDMEASFFRRRSAGKYAKAMPANAEFLEAVRVPA